MRNGSGGRPATRVGGAVAILAIVIAPLAGCDSTVAPTTPLASASPSPAASPPSLAPEAIRGRLAFSSETPDGTDDVFLLDLRFPAGERRRLTDGLAREFDPDLSPDGTRIAFRVNPDDASDAADIWVTNVDGSLATNLTGDPSLDNWSPAWSPDGSRIAFASSREGGTMSVWTMAPDGTGLHRVTRGHGEYPDWSPDGSRLVYAAPRTGTSGRYDLWTIDVDGSEAPQRLTTEPTTEFAPAWSPDGEWIAYQADAGDRWELWVIGVDGSNAQRLSPDGEDGVWPAWSPDGLLVWGGTQGLSFADVAGGARLSIQPRDPGTGFLSWGP